MRRLTLLFAFFTLTFTAFAQKGKIEGKLTDAKTGLPLSGVSVLIKNSNKGVATDQEGRYVINADANTRISLIFSYNGVSKEVEDIEVANGKTTTQNITLEVKAKTSDAVVVRSSSNARKETAAALISYQKNTSVVAQVISAETIKRSPDKNTGEVLKRVTGTSIQEGKYLVVRGLSDRYNQAMLNGILLSSTEPDRKTFSFDIFPAAMIDNIIMNKTFIPELPGEWAGGLVQVQTRDVPAASFLNVQAGTGFNSNTIGKDFLQARGGKMDWLGIDNGARGLPSSIPVKSVFSALTPAEKTNLGKDFRNNWVPVSGSAPVNSSFQINGGGSIKLFGKKVAGIFALTYNQSNKRTPFNNTFIANNEGDVELLYYNNKYSRDLLAGGLANITVQLNNNNKISLKNLININTTDFVTDRYDGRDFIISGGGNGDKVKATEIGFRQNTFFNTQLIGEHNLPKWETKLKWYGGFNILDQYIPDQRRLFYTQDGTNPNAPYYALLGLGAGQKSGSIFYSFLNDYIYNAGADITKSVNFKGKKHAIKAGYLFQVKDRLFDSRPFYTNTASNAIKLLSADQLYAPENFGTGNDKVQFDEINGNAYRYMANTILNAVYLQFDNPIGNKIRLVWGARYESYDQLVGSTQKSDPRHVNTIVKDLLPGINLTYKLNNKTNFRFAASQTVIRPEFRELSPFAFYDFELGAQVVGNRTAQRTKVSNFDLRYELYPRAGELFTAGVYFKHFDKPIEYYFNRTGPGTNTFNILNTKNATAFGGEVEFRKKLDFIRGLKNFTLSGNLSYIHSRVKDTTGTINRPLQGQSPYLINFGIQYDVEKLGFTSTLLFNQIGRRILFVGNEAISDIWEAPRPLLDLQLAKKLFHNKGEIKLNISDLINSRANFYHDLDNNKKYRSESKDVLAITRNYGTNYTLTFAYQIK
ncbi:MAG: outer membrane beta-barrel protein [Chitinophagaceae bacterium]|nr:outer membrane beta-barrel protein [Chitinophagaceae bacterium]MBL0055761.1 outer membrane beta-barrel protein [Chitinophagaceae bacterium]